MAFRMATRSARKYLICIIAGFGIVAVYFAALTMRPRFAAQTTGLPIAITTKASPQLQSDRTLVYEINVKNKNGGNDIYVLDMNLPFAVDPKAELPASYIRLIDAPKECSLSGTGDRIECKGLRFPSHETTILRLKLRLDEIYGLSFCPTFLKTKVQLRGYGAEIQGNSVKTKLTGCGKAQIKAKILQDESTKKTVEVTVTNIGKASMQKVRLTGNAVGFAIGNFETDSGQCEKGNALTSSSFTCDLDALQYKERFSITAEYAKLNVPSLNQVDCRQKSLQITVVANGIGGTKETQVLLPFERCDE